MRSALRTVLLGKWTPNRLFLGGKKGVWYDPSDLSTMFQNSNGTTAVAVGDPVGYIADKSGNGKHAIMATAGQRPILRDGGYLEFDASNDWIGVATPGFSAAMDVLSCNRRQTGSVIPISMGYNGANFYALAISGDGALATGSGDGFPTYNVNGVAVPGTTNVTRAQLYTAWPIDTDCVLDTLGLDLSAWTAFGFGNFTSFANLKRVYGLIARETLSLAELAKTRTYLGAKAGLVI